MNQTPKGWHNCSDDVETPAVTHCATPSGFDLLSCLFRGLRMLRMLHPPAIYVSPLRGLVVLRTISGGCACFACSTPGYICVTPSGFDWILHRYRGFRTRCALHPRLFMCRPIRGLALHLRTSAKAPSGLFVSPPMEGARSRFAVARECDAPCVDRYRLAKR